MSLQDDNKALIRRWFAEVWNKGRAEAMQEMLASDGIVHGLGAAPLRGPGGFLPFFRKFRQAFPDLQIAVEETIAEGDLVTARCVVRGRHTGDALGLAPTHRDTQFTGMTIVRIKDGKVVEAWNDFDFLALYQQLGAFPPA